MHDRIDNQVVQSKRCVVMGVSGCGKSAIGRRLAQRLGFAYVEGDDHHTAGNIAKMAAGIPLDDNDRHAWLLILQSRIRSAKERDEGLVLSCSSLKRRYRDLLRLGDPSLIFIHLDGDRELIASRMQARPGHFMPPALLESQFRDLEPLAKDERGIRIDIKAEPEKLVNQIVAQYAAL